MSGRVPDRRFAAIVLAGSRAGEDPVARARGVAHKALVTVGDVPMVERVVGALAGSKWVERIALVVEGAVIETHLPDVARLRASGRLTVVPPRPSPSLSALAAIERMGEGPFLLTTADHALLDDAILDRFCAAAVARGADVAVALTPAEAIEAAYPESRRTYWRFADGRFSGANLFAFMNEASFGAVRFWRRVEEERKRPWRVARAFGWRPLLAYATGRLTLDAAMARAGAVLGVRAAAVRLPIAEAAIDVDKPEDLELVERILAARARAAMPA